MTTNQTISRPMEEPLAELERELITGYVADAGQDLDSLLARTDEQARQLLKDASSYATARLTEVESRAHYLRSLHGKA